MIDPWDLRWCRQVAITAAAVITAVAFYMIYRAMTAPPAMSGSVTAACTTRAFSFRAHAYYKSDGRRWRIDHYLYRFRGGDGHGGGGLFAVPNPRGTFNDLNVAVMTNDRLVGWDSTPTIAGAACSTAGRADGRRREHQPLRPDRPVVQGGLRRGRWL